jgi:hypothetical protein
MYGTSNTYGEEEECEQNVGREVLGEETTWGNPGLGGKIILIWV